MSPAGPVVGDDEVRLAFEDPSGAVQRVRLRIEHELARPDVDYEFWRDGRPGRFELRLPLPDADRVEYQLEVRGAGGEARLLPDPANPLRARGPFGQKSVLELPGYRPPAWLEVEAPRGSVRPLELESTTLGTTIQGVLWATRGVARRRALPLLVVNDGPEYAEYSELLRFLDAQAALRSLPPMRAALLHPVVRHETYAASSAYAAALARELLPQIERLAPTPGERRMRAGMGASLGALAMLHAHRAYPRLFGALFLQSGSFFRPRPQEGRQDPSARRRIPHFVGGVLATQRAVDAIAAILTCGAHEQNLRNNRAMARALSAQGYTARLRVRRDLHNWVAWRDAFDPHLVGLLRSLWT